MNNKQRGMTLIEILGALAIGAVMLMGLSALIDTSLEDVEGQQASLYQAQVVAAARDYITANYQALLAATPTAATVVPVSVDMLKTGNFLPASFGTVNAYGQSSCVLVRQPVAASGKLDALIVTSGGQPIEERQIPVVASSAGQGGGYVSKLAPAIARGSSWSLDTTPFRGTVCPGSASASLTGGANDGGHLASNLFYDGPGQLSTDFLYRSAVPGRPELNQMNTPLKLANAAVVTAGTACGTVAAIAVDASREVLKCGSNGLWNYLTTWKNPVADFSSLPLTDNDGDVRMALDKRRAFVFDKPNSKWVALAVDQNGDLAVERDLNVGRDIKGGRHASIASNITAGGDIEAGKQLRGDSLEVADYGEIETLTIKRDRVPGDACHLPVGNGQVIWPVGTIAVDQGGLLMSCHADHTFRYPNGKYTP